MEVNLKRTPSGNKAELHVGNVIYILEWDEVESLLSKAFAVLMEHGRTGQ